MTHIDSPSLSPARRKRRTKALEPVKAHDAFDKLICELEMHRPHEIVGSADSVDALERMLHLGHFYKAVDRYLLEIGTELRDHDRELDLSQFTEQLAGALQGNATFEMDQMAERLRRGLS